MREENGSKRVRLREWGGDHEGPSSHYQLEESLYGYFTFGLQRSPKSSSALSAELLG